MKEAYTDDDLQEAVDRKGPSIVDEIYIRRRRVVRNILARLGPGGAYELSVAVGRCSRRSITRQLGAAMKEWLAALDEGYIASIEARARFEALANEGESGD